MSSKNHQTDNFFLTIVAHDCKIAEIMNENVNSRFFTRFYFYGSLPDEAVAGA